MYYACETQNLSYITMESGTKYVTNKHFEILILFKLEFEKMKSYPSKLFFQLCFTSSRCRSIGWVFKQVNNRTDSSVGIFLMIFFPCELKINATN